MCKRKKIFLLNLIEKIPFQLKSKITLVLFSKALSPFKDFFFKRNLRATATSAINCFQHIGWNLGIFILGFGTIQTLTWWQYVWGRKGVKWLSRRRRQTHLLLKLNNANYAEKHQCQQGSSPSTWKEMALFPNQS